MGINIDVLVKSQKAPVIVIPVKTGIQENQSRRETTALAGVTALETFHETINIYLAIIRRKRCRNHQKN